MVTGSSQSKTGFAGRVNVIEKVRQVFQEVLCAQGLTLFLTISYDLIKDTTFPYKSCLLYTFRASHFQRAYHSRSVDKAAIKGCEEHFFMSFFFFLSFFLMFTFNHSFGFPWCSGCFGLLSGLVLLFSFKVWSYFGKSEPQARSRSVWHENPFEFAAWLCWQLGGASLVC